MCIVVAISCEFYCELVCILSGHSQTFVWFLEKKRWTSCATQTQYMKNAEARGSRGMFSLGKWMLKTLSDTKFHEIILLAILIALQKYITTQSTV